MKCRILSLSVLLVLSMATAAMAGSKMLYDSSSPHVPIQNVTAIAPAKLKSGCVTTAATKGAIQGQYSSIDGYHAYETDVFTIYSSAATQLANPRDAMVMYEVDGVMMAIAHTFRMTNSGGSTYKRAVQKVYSSPKKRTFSTCIRRQQ